MNPHRLPPSLSCRSLERVLLDLLADLLGHLDQLDLRPQERQVLQKLVQRVGRDLRVLERSRGQPDL